MNKLTVLAAPPSRARFPHSYRRLGSGVLVSDESGRSAVLGAARYAAWLRGRGRAPFIPEEVGPGLAAWRGPANHVLRLDGMALETVKLAVDFIFSSHSTPLRLEFVCGAAEDARAAVWFAVQYARRKSEWGKRPVSLSLRTRARPGTEQLAFLRGHGVSLRLETTLAGAPSGAPAFAAERVLLRLTPEARAPKAWAAWCAKAGLGSALLVGDGPAGFSAAFHAAGPRDEWAEALLARRPWELPGMDVLGELAYAPDGGVFTSELALDEGSDLLRLGVLGKLRFSDLGGSAAVRACLAAALPENQPLCAPCVYNPFCALAPSENLRAQGTVWGQTPSSAACAARMALLDRLFDK